MQGKCSWVAAYQDIMRRNFHIRAAARFSDLLRRARIRFEESGKRPHWIGPPIFDELVKYWASAEFKEKSQKAKLNRASEKGGCIHTGGCLSNGEHAERMVKIINFYLFFRIIFKFDCFKLMIWLDLNFIMPRTLFVHWECSSGAPLIRK